VCGGPLAAASCAPQLQSTVQLLAAAALAMIRDELQAKCQWC